jgi:hypothetical protein
MPIDVATALAADPSRHEASWSAKDVVLYHLGIGAGTPAGDRAELRYTYEGNLQVLPSFLTVIGGGALVGGLSSLPGVDVDLKSVLHGGQEIVVHRPLPVQATITTSSRVRAVYDKGRAAVIVLEGSGTLADGTELYTSLHEIFVRGEGGFGGDRRAADPRRPGPALPPVRRLEPAARRSGIRQGGRLRRPDPARPVLVRTRPQGRG